MNRTWRLADHVHAAVCGIDLVILDAHDGAYFCLPGAAIELQIDAARGEIETADYDLAFTLRDAGLISPAEGPDRPTRQALPEAPRRDLASLEGPPIRFRDVLAFALTWLRAVGHYHGRAFDHVLSSGGPSARSNSLSELLIDRSLAFRRLLPWAPFQGVCLYRSHLLKRHLHAVGHEVQWVIGVQTWPFAAHCWLQANDTVLDDTADNVAAYTPILVV